MDRRRDPAFPASSARPRDRPAMGSAEHFGRGAGRHSSRGSRLRLTAAFRAGQRRSLGDHCADQSRRRQPIDDFVFAMPLALRASPVSTAGRTPAPPAVGAATMTPMAAFTSWTASARARMSRNGVRPADRPARSAASPRLHRRGPTQNKDRRSSRRESLPHHLERSASEDEYPRADRP